MSREFQVRDRLICRSALEKGGDSRAPLKLLGIPIGSQTETFHCSEDRFISDRATAQNVALNYCPVVAIVLGVKFRDARAQSLEQTD